MPQAFSEYGEKIDFHPVSYVQFSGYKIKNVDKIIKVAIDCHKRTPHMRIASWDFTLDKNGDPVLIEVNLYSQSIWLVQIAHGEGIFGKNTDKTLKLYWK